MNSVSPHIIITISTYFHQVEHTKKKLRQIDSI